MCSIAQKRLRCAPSTIIPIPMGILQIVFNTFWNVIIKLNIKVLNMKWIINQVLLLAEQAYIVQQHIKIQNIQTQVVSFPFWSDFTVNVGRTALQNDLCNIAFKLLYGLRNNFSCFQSSACVCLTCILNKLLKYLEHKYSQSDLKKVVSAFHRYLLIQKKAGNGQPRPWFNDLTLDDFWFYDFLPHYSWITEKCMTCQTYWRCALSNKNFSHMGHRETNRNL